MSNDWIREESQYPGSLHNHTCYSNLKFRDSINRISTLIDYAIELGHEVVAITEHDSISNAIKVEKYYDSIKEKYPYFKVIRGNEIYLCRNGLNSENFIPGTDKYYHFILLAKDAIGHQQIRELSTRAWTRSYFARNQRRIPTYYSDLEEIIGANPGHVIGATACLGGCLATQLLRYGETYDEDLYAQIINWSNYLNSIFGQDHFYFELQPSGSPEQNYVNTEIIKLSEKTGIPYIITTDSHYLKKEDAGIHEAYLNSQDADREVKSFYATTYMMGTKELESYTLNSVITKERIVKAYNNIRKISEMCENYSLKKELVIPRLQWVIPELKTIDSYWFERIPYLEKFYSSDYEGDNILARSLIEKIITEPEEFDNEKTYQAIDDCLEKTWTSSLVNKTHWSAYFLNLQMIIEECWRAGTLVGPGRGSGVGFILLDMLGITQINPLRETTETFSFRFLNPDRVSVLDVDVDIEGGRRGQVLQHLRKAYGEDRISNVGTFKTEKSKAAIQTAARGLGIDVDTARYLSSLVPEERGQAYSLKQCFYGDPDNDIKPTAMFVREMTENYPELWRVAQEIEGLVCGVGIHAGGIIFVDEPFTNSTALMRAPDNTLITQFDLHDDEDVSLIKIDLLSVEALDKIHTCLDLLVEHGEITAEPTLKETYEKVVGIYNLERNAPDMWKLVWEHKIQALFQMEKQSGIQGIALTHPTNVDELAVLNSVIRLMAQEKGGETPLENYARFRKNPKAWDEEMLKCGLTAEERKFMHEQLDSSNGLCITQEQFMKLVQLPEVGGFDLQFADALRKAIAKKNPKAYDELTVQFFNNAKEKNLSPKLCDYIWNRQIALSRGYGFNASHTLAYSLVGLQEMNLAYRFPIIYWNCACLITDSGGAEYDEEDTKTTNYGKIATAIGKMRSAGINITLPNINDSAYTFYPDAKNNRILYGLRGMTNVGDDLVNTIIQNRPYASIKDFYNRVKPNKQAMVSLIRAGVFDDFMDRNIAMGWYIWETCDKKKKLTLQNIPTFIKYNMLPEDTEERIMARRVYEFNRYLKACCLAKKTDSYYTLDERAINFLTEIECDYLINEYMVDIKSWKKIYDSWMDILRSWLSVVHDEILEKLNFTIFKEDWEKYAEGNYSSWEMSALGFYYHEHELQHVNTDRYGISDFASLPEEPVIEKWFDKGGKRINMYKLNKICGTCISKDKAKGTVTLLTTTGVVNVKFRKEYFTMYDKQISRVEPDGTKKVVEKSFFNKGNMIVVMGIRSGDDFIVKKYASSSGEQLYHIDKVNKDGTITLRHERASGDEEDE